MVSADAMYLLQVIGNDGSAAISPDQMKFVRKEGYAWKYAIRSRSESPEAFLCMNAYVRL